MKKLQNIIVTKLKGGLGNQLFQYATGFTISSNNGVEMKIDNVGFDDLRYIKNITPRKYMLGYFNITKKLANNDEIRGVKYPFGFISKLFRFFKIKVLRQKNLDYHSYIKDKKKYYLDGFWQSEKNFIEKRDALINEFSLRKEFQSDKYIQMSNSILSSDSLSVHVRRGDYVNHENTNKYHGVTEINYYKKAIEYITKKTNISVIYFFTDDPIWVKDNLSIPDYKCIHVSDYKLQDYEELLLMSKCKHNIIANSTFSWWGAWLNQNPNKIVIAPKKWVNIEPNPHPNIIPETWITM